MGVGVGVWVVGGVSARWVFGCVGGGGGGSLAFLWRELFLGGQERDEGFSHECFEGVATITLVRTGVVARP